MRHYRAISVALILVLTAAYISVIETLTADYVITSNSKDVLHCDVTVVIDAGHGGEDGGTVGTSGSLEKDINLAIASSVKRLFDLTDINVVMTRDEDKLLYGEGQENRKKYYDVRNRVELVSKISNPVFVSIHQNSFPISKYSGLQVYYSPNNGESRTLAKRIQDFTSNYLQKENTRSIKEAGRNIYVLKALNCPSVLVECGFLSNYGEEQLLMDEKYQNKVAFVIFSAVVDYLTCADNGNV